MIFAQNYKVVKKNAGFTLVELVLILVLLGILGAVAVPKYFDLQDEAQQKAARLAVAEAQSRIEARFSELILNGETCSKAVDEVKVLTKLSDSTKDDQAVFGDYGLSAEEIASTGTEVTVKVLGDEDQKVVFSGSQPKLYVPACADEKKTISAKDVADAIYKAIKNDDELKKLFKDNSKQKAFSYENDDVANAIRELVKSLGKNADAVLWMADSKGGQLRVIATEISEQEAKAIPEDMRKNAYVKATFIDMDGTSYTGYTRLRYDGAQPYIDATKINLSENWFSTKEAVKVANKNAQIYGD